MNTKTKSNIEIEADEAFEKFYIELVYKFPSISNYMGKDMLNVAWIAGATWATENSNRRLEEIIK